MSEENTNIENEATEVIDEIKDEKKDEIIEEEIVEEKIIHKKPEYDNRRRDNRDDKKKFFFTKKVCKFCTNQIEEKAIDYKNVDLMRRFVMPSGKIIPRRINGNCARHQRIVAREVKNIICDEAYIVRQ